jgi:SET domain-containing protein
MSLIFTAARDIDRDRELTINYNAREDGHLWHDDNWFIQENVPLITE